jgi:L-arabinose isomerase
VRVPRRKPRTASVGVFGVGHYTYWKQFDGLLDEMRSKMDALVNKIKACGVQVTNFGLIDSAQGASALQPRLKAAGLDLIFCDMVHMPHRRPSGFSFANSTCRSYLLRSSR